MDADPKVRGRLNTVVPALRRAGAAAALLGACLAAACATLPVGTPDAAPVIEPIAPPAVARLVVPPRNAAAVPARPRSLPAPVERGPVVVIVSSDLPAYVEVASHLEALFGAARVRGYVLDELVDPAELPAEIAAAKPRATVAIGLGAALFAATELTSAPVVFCQVLNYAEHDELMHTAGGVSALPSISQQFRYWKNVDGKLHRIGAIAGPGHDALLAEAERAANEQNLDFRHRVSQSDQETIYLFKRLAAQIDGFWLIPDNRILSLSAIREILSYATERNVRVVVSNPGLLKFGALMSLSLSPTQIAEAVYDIVDSLRVGDERGFEVFAPTRFDVEINPSVAKQLNLEFD